MTAPLNLRYLPTLEEYDRLLDENRQLRVELADSERVRADLERVCEQYEAQLGPEQPAARPDEPVGLPEPILIRRAWRRRPR